MLTLTSRQERQINITHICKTANMKIRSVIAIVPDSLSARESEFVEPF